MRVDKRAFFLFLGIACVFLSYLLYNGQQYFSFAAMISIFIMFACGAFFLLLPNYIKDNKISNKYLRSLAVILTFFAAITVIFELYFDLQYSTGILASDVFYLPMIIAAFIPIISAYLIGKRLENLKSYKSYALLLVLIVIISIAAFYVVRYTLHNVKWERTDEIAFDYYASYLFSKGVNPYITNMAGALSKFSLRPTELLNGTCECTYGYPVLSFMPFVPTSLLGIQSLYLFAYVTVICTIFVVFFLYYKSNRSVTVLFLLFAFLFLVYANRPGSSTKYIAVSVMLLIAYYERKRVYVQGVFLGLAAATHQLAWIAIPFFYALTLREHGKGPLLIVVAVSVGIFLLINSYFIALSPKATLGDLFYLLTSKIQIEGPNLTQILLAFYHAPYWYSTVVLALFYAASITLFYFYTNTLKPFLALVPATITILSKLSESAYFLPFIPLLIYIYYIDRNECPDELNSKSYVLYAVLFIVVVSALLLLYAHVSYLHENTLQMSKISYSVSRNGTTNVFYLSGLQFYITNNGNKNETLLFQYITRNSDNQAYQVVTGAVLFPNETVNFSIPYSVSSTFAPSIHNSTKLYVYLYSNDYAIGNETTIRLTK